MSESEPLLINLSRSQSESKTPSRGRRIAAIVVLILLVTLWVGMAEVAAAMQQGCGTGAKAPYHKPYAVTYVIHAGYVLFLPIAMIWSAVASCRQPPVRHGVVVQWAKWRRLLAKCALMGGIVTFLCGYGYYAALPLNPVSVNVAIYNSASALVYFFSLIFGLDHFNWRKCLALAVSIGGVCMVQFLATKTTEPSCPSPTPSAPHALKSSEAGYVLIVVSTLVYALYEVLYKHWLSPSIFRDAAPMPKQDLHLIQDPDEASVWSDVHYAMLTLGLIGAFHLMLTWPGLILLDYAGVESFALPARDAAEQLITTMLLDTIFNVLLLIGIALTSPLFISVGCLLTIPASALSDWLLHKPTMSLGSLGGVALIVVGFGILAWAEHLESKNKKRQ